MEQLSEILKFYWGLYKADLGFYKDFDNIFVPLTCASQIVSFAETNWTEHIIGNLINVLYVNNWVQEPQKYLLLQEGQLRYTSKENIFN